MKNNRQSNKATKKKFNPLSYAAIAVAAVAVIVSINSNGNNTDKNQTVGVASTVASTVSSTVTSTVAKNTTSTNSSYVPAILNDKGDVVIQLSDITENAKFYKYDANGTTIGLFAVKASDGTIRTAFDTCQVCNGSPKAYFEQKGDTFQCQNCGNVYSLNMIEQERGGCNPVPIMKNEKTVTDAEIIIPAKLLKDNAGKFENWKKL